MVVGAGPGRVVVDAHEVAVVGVPAQGWRDVPAVRGDGVKQASEPDVSLSLSRHDGPLVGVGDEVPDAVGDEGVGRLLDVVAAPEDVPDLVAEGELAQGETGPGHPDRSTKGLFHMSISTRTKNAKYLKYLMVHTVYSRLLI